jgi:hypothetical protein
MRLTLTLARLKIKNPYSQTAGRRELFDRRPGDRAVT